VVPALPLCSQHVRVLAGVLVLFCSQNGASTGVV
jgi:hypothetical protein